MAFIVQNKFWVRIFVLALFIISMLGNWAFELINTRHSCHEPYVRLYGDFCIYTLSGFEVIRLFAGPIFTTLLDILFLTGWTIENFASKIPSLIALIVILMIMLPFFSSLLPIRNKYSRGLQIMNIIGWVLAFLLTIILFILEINRADYHFMQFFYLLWGLWLYSFLALGTILFEILVLRSDTNDEKSGLMVTGAAFTEQMSYNLSSIIKRSQEWLILKRK